MSGLNEPARNWAGRVITITGPTGGFGSACARAAAARGATLVLAGRRIRQVEKLLDEVLALGGTDSAIYPINFEGASPGDYAELFATVERECGRLDALIHAAAQFDGLFSIGQIGAEAWLRMFQVNCHAPHWLTQAALPLLVANRGQIVFPLEDAERMPKAFWNAYGASKAALATLASQYQQELEGRGVQVHAFAPGPMRTALRAKAYFAEDARTIDAPEVAATRLLTELDQHWA